MSLVVNHLHFREPVTDSLAVSFQQAAEALIAAGCRSARVAKVDDTYLILLLEFDSATDADRISRDVGGPWMRDHVVPLLNTPPERAVCDVIATAGR